MFVDASAIVAIVTAEADSVLLGAKLREAQERYTSPLAIYESVLGIARILKAPPEEVSLLVDDFIADADIRLFVIDRSIARAAIDAFARYGKGRHRAALNMGDCFAYACAKSLGVPLLCKGDDFPHTDILRA